MEEMKPTYTIKKQIVLPIDELEQDDDFFTVEIPILVSIPKGLRKALIDQVLSELISFEDIRPIENDDIQDFLSTFEEIDDIVDHEKLVNILKDILKLS